MILLSEIEKSQESIRRKRKMQELVIVPITKEEEKALRGLYEKYDNIERSTGHPFIRAIATQRKFQVLELLGSRQRQ